MKKPPDIIIYFSYFCYIDLIHFFLSISFFLFLLISFTFFLFLSLSLYIYIFPSSPLYGFSSPRDFFLSKNYFIFKNFFSQLKKESWKHERNQSEEKYGTKDGDERTTKSGRREERKGEREEKETDF